MQADNPENRETELQNEAPTSVHTSNFPDLLRHFNISLAVTTYQAGKLILLRPDGDKLNTHFRPLPRPMGMAVSREHFHVGCKREIVKYVNIPEVAQKIEPFEGNDAVYIRRNSHTTGEIDIHEMAYGNQGLWFINTRFSTLCTVHENFSFVPRWKPRFITELMPEDRCHLNGLCMENGEPRYVSALGKTDAAGGWRQNKKDGGLLIDVTDDRVVAEGLSMPHSPRIYEGRLWLLESGHGRVGTVDIASGRYSTLCELDGFTRGLAFAGNIAFVGLSQIRESASFGGVPLAEKLKEKERIAGVWAIDIRTGETVAFVRFTAGVQEVFAVEILPGMQRPEVLEPDDSLVATSYNIP